MEPLFDHEKLKVYQRAIDFVHHARKSLFRIVRQKPLYLLGRRLQPVHVQVHTTNQ